MNTPNMTTEQAAELKTLRKEETQKLKALTRLEKQLRADIRKHEAHEAKLKARLEKALRHELRENSRTTAKHIKPLQTMLHRLSQGRVPEASALAAIRKRIAILDQRLTS